MIKVKWMMSESKLKKTIRTVNGPFNEVRSSNSSVSAHYLKHENP